MRSADPVMASLVERIGTLDPITDRPTDLYGALLRAIVGQQLSVVSARAIFGRLTERFGGRPPTPEEVLADDPDELRTAVGLSHAKTRYLRSLAECVQDGTLELGRLEQLEDDLVIAELIQVKGLGLWTAHMFLMFTLGRPDVLAWGDLGIRQAAERLYELDGPPKQPELEALAEPWRPWRSVACRYLWQSLQTAPV